jgi:uncharacterized UBP type Zn finger protein
VQLILLLDLCLQCVLSMCKGQVYKHLTGSSSHAAINAS